MNVNILKRGVFFMTDEEKEIENWFQKQPAPVKAGIGVIGICCVVLTLFLVINTVITITTTYEVKIGSLEFRIPVDYINGSKLNASDGKKGVSKDPFYKSKSKKVFAPKNKTYDFMIVVKPSKKANIKKIKKEGINTTINGINGYFFKGTSKDGKMKGNHYFLFKYRGKNVVYVLSKHYKGDPLEFFSQIKIDNYKAEKNKAEKKK